ncbi:LysM domain-containing protein [Pinirhizobacter sp.]|jgi:hypothetical protein|uniref:LysM domain-containing protein n=1 Tax=Pinirhizobacter sp. TaxID=2950432 RepID=UPI002F3E6AA4
MVTIAANSRYLTTPTATFTQADGTPVVYFTRRFVPQPGKFATMQWHVVKQGERLDQIAWAAFGDAELFWRICDANRTLRPEDLTDEIGTRLRITLPEGVPGVGDA